MATESLLVQRTADEVDEAKREAEKLVALMDEVLSDQEVTVDEMTAIVAQARRFMREMFEAHWWANYTFSMESAFESARRGAALTPSPYKREKFERAGMALIGVQAPVECLETANAADLRRRVCL